MTVRDSIGFHAAMGLEDDFLIQCRKAAGMIGITAIVVILTWHLLFPPKPIPLSRADGQYANGLCGIVTFDKGTITSGATKAKYTLDDDKIGMFALTGYLVGVKMKGASCSISTEQKKMSTQNKIQ